jgi:hypothetical protein
MAIPGISFVICYMFLADEAMGNWHSFELYWSLPFGPAGRFELPLVGVICPAGAAVEGDICGLYLQLPHSCDIGIKSCCRLLLFRGKLGSLVTSTSFRRPIGPFRELLRCAAGCWRFGDILM